MILGSSHFSSIFEDLNLQKIGRDFNVELLTFKPTVIFMMRSHQIYGMLNYWKLPSPFFVASSRSVQHMQQIKLHELFFGAVLFVFSAVLDAIRHRFL